ncbi:hypothetical protein V6N12_062685 [Hibiscus sabdariffa]|uniref:Uncharacterized protein n=1 Tax=Hibiscus sabdariffa TaxID=183260 RepID=A0ABR2F9N5_9ROSI
MANLLCEYEIALDCTKYIKVTNKLPKGFNFPLQWRKPSKSKRTSFDVLLRAEPELVTRLSSGDWLDVPEVIMLQNVFRYMLRANSLNAVEEPNILVTYCACPLRPWLYATVSSLVGKVFRPSYNAFGSGHSREELGEDDNN